LQELNRILVECGATIEEINLIRKQFSAVKGGKLRRWMKSSKAIALFALDVNAGDLKTLASNPLFPEAEAGDRVQAIIKRYELADHLPRLFQLLRASFLPASLEIDENIESSLDAFLLAENAEVINAAGRAAHRLGFSVWLDRSDNEAAYQETAARLISVVADMKKANPGRAVCVVSGGEVACPVKGRGFGGRNQEFVLYCAMKLREASLGEAVVLSCGTDGIDGRSIAVGAIARASQPAIAKLVDLRLHDYFQASDTTSWFNEFGGLLVTGPTGNNLRDLRLILSH
jgi:glycerate-2-kinase